MPTDLDPGLTLILLSPIYFLFIGAEAFYCWRKGNGYYAREDTVANLALSIMHQGGEWLASMLFIHTIYAWVYANGAQAIGNSAWNWPLVFILQDFLYYWFHRASHRVGWLWASHVTHHSSERMNLSTAFRQSLTYPVSGMWVFWLPLAWLGFSPETVVLVVNLNLGYQFFIHTEIVRKLGWFEQIFNTPSHHRVHHATNPQYIDRNYAGMLIIWDKLFGSFAEEIEKPVYGIVHPVKSFNPLWLTFHQWVAMFQDTIQQRDLRYLWKPPGWSATPTKP